MSFTFKWPRFSDRFHEEARDMLHAALNKGNKPPIIADKIEVVELEMGTQPPELEIKDIGELTQDQFRGIFKLTYSGDAFIVLRTKVQANPLNHRKNEISDLLGMGGSRGILAAHQPLVVPMLLRLSQFRLNSYVVLVLSKHKGCTLVFKTDPLQNVEVSSTFDSIAVIQSFIQREIEEQLREMFREDLPGIIHKLSQRWVAGRMRVDAPYLKAQQPPPPATATTPKKRSTPPSSIHRGSSLVSSMTGRAPESVLSQGAPPAPGIGLQPGLYPRSGFARPVSSPGRSRSGQPLSSIAPSSSASRSPLPRKSGTKTPVSSDFPINPHSSLPDIENFDPTYGLRPEGMPMQSGYSGLGKLFGESRGLRELAEDKDRISMVAALHSDLDAESAYDVVEWADGLDPNAGVYHGHEDDIDEGDDGQYYRLRQEVVEDVEAMETLPAVGGGFITRPRIYHSQSSIKSPLSPGIPVGIHPSGPHGSRKIREDATRVQLGGGGSSVESRSQTIPHRVASTHRDRGMSMEMEGGMLDSYNPYFGDAYKNHERATYVEAASKDVEEDDLTNTTEGALRESASVSRSIPTSTRRRQSASSDLHHRSVSRSPLTNDPFQYGSPPKQHLRYSSDEADRDPLMNLTSNRHRGHGQDPRSIILRNQSASHLSTLSKSNQTLSPYTRSFSHFTVRSGPPKPLVSNTAPFSRSTTKGPQKARRKRIHRIGAAKDGHAGSGRANTSADRRKGADDDENEANISLDRLSHSPAPPSEFSDDDVAHYFRTRRPSEVVHSPRKRGEKKLFSSDGAGVAPVCLRERTTSHSSHRSRKQTTSP